MCVYIGICMCLCMYVCMCSTSIWARSCAPWLRQIQSGVREYFDKPKRKEGEFTAIPRLGSDGNLWVQFLGFMWV